MEVIPISKEDKLPREYADDTKKIVYLDMDGVLADFDGACTSGYTFFENKPVEMLVAGFYRNLKVMPGAREAVTKLLADDRYDVWIGTKPSTNNLYCATEKMLWIQEHFPELIRKTMIVCDKGLLRGDYLIDDDVKWGGRFKGKMFLFQNKNPKKAWEKVLQDLGI